MNNGNSWIVFGYRKKREEKEKKQDITHYQHISMKTWEQLDRFWLYRHRFCKVGLHT